MKAFMPIAGTPVRGDQRRKSAYSAMCGFDARNGAVFGFKFVDGIFACVVRGHMDVAVEVGRDQSG